MGECCERWSNTRPWSPWCSARSMRCVGLPAACGNRGARGGRAKPARLHSIHGSCAFTCCLSSAPGAFAAASAGVTMTAPPLRLASHLRGSWLPLPCDFFHTHTIEALPDRRGPSSGSGGVPWLCGGAAFPSPDRVLLAPGRGGSLLC